MRAMTWCLGILVLVAWHSNDLLHGAPAGWPYVCAMFFWFLVALGSLTVQVIRLVSGKLRAGLPGPRPQARPGTPAEKREA